MMYKSAGYNLQTLPPDQQDNNVQTNFTNTMSNVLSSYIGHYNRDPLRNRADRFELGITGGAARPTDTLFFPAGISENVIAPTVKQPGSRRRKRWKQSKKKKGKRKVAGGGGGGGTSSTGGRKRKQTKKWKKGRKVKSS